MQTLRFGSYALDLRRCSLMRGQEQLGLRPKAFDVLRYLVENPGRVVSKDELMGAVWPGVFVTEDALVHCISDVRHALSDNTQQIIETVPRRGYLFAAEVLRNEAASRPLPADQRDQKVTFCRTKDGINLAMSCVGQGLPLVRTATWLNHLEYDWKNPIRSGLCHFLADRFQLVRYDGRGNGLSDRNVADISFATSEQDLETVIDALQLRQYALLGISQGAATAIAHVVRHPERVTKMVFHGAYALGRNKRASSKERETAQAYLTLMRHGWGDEHSAFLQALSSIYFPRGTADQIRDFAELQRVATSAENAIKLRAACDNIDVVDLLPKVTVPTLVLHSRYDNVVPYEEGRRIAASIPNARFVTLESENHVPLPGEPAWSDFVGNIEAFLAQ